MTFGIPFRRSGAVRTGTVYVAPRPLPVVPETTTGGGSAMATPGIAVGLDLAVELPDPPPASSYTGVTTDIDHGLAVDLSADSTRRPADPSVVITSDVGIGGSVVATGAGLGRSVGDGTLEDLLRDSGTSTSVAIRRTGERGITGDIPISSRIPPIIFAPPEPVALPPAERYSEDTLNLSRTSIINNVFGIVQESGISSFRPEILSVIDFAPIWYGDPREKILSDVGRLIDTQIQALYLRRDTLRSTLNNIFGAEPRRAASTLSSMRSRFDGVIRELDSLLGFQSTLIDAIATIKQSLDIKTIPKDAFEYLTIDEFFERKMQFKKSSFDIFSNTKILYQLIFDAKSILETYSLDLLDSVDPDRIDDKDPIKIDKTYSNSDGFTFSIGQIRSETSAQNASEPAYFTQILNSLPNNPDDRIKLLTTLLSKEYRVSKALGTDSIQRALRSSFQSGFTGNPFDNMFGNVGDTIFDPPAGPDSLASLISFVSTPPAVATVYPFEKKYIDIAGSTRVYIPGSAYLVDTVLDLKDGGFNVTPLVDYSTKFSKVITAARNILNPMFFNEAKLSPISYNLSILSSLENALAGTATIVELNSDQAIVSAIFKLANEDPTLKLQLFQYCLLLGLITNAPTDPKPIFKILAYELAHIHNLSEVRAGRDVDPSLIDGHRTLQPYLDQLATDIENRIFSLTTTSHGVRGERTAELGGTSFGMGPTTPDSSPLSIHDRTTSAGLDSSTTTITVARETIKRILQTNILAHSTAATNVFLEFVKLANQFSQWVSVDGEQIYLLNDRSGRTKYNFVSTSTQLLMLFEILSSFISKYSSCYFNRSSMDLVAFITVDAGFNDYIIRVFREIQTNFALPRTPDGEPEVVAIPETARMELETPGARSSGDSGDRRSGGTGTVVGALSEDERRRLLGGSGGAAVETETTLRERSEEVSLGEGRAWLLRLSLKTIAGKLKGEDETIRNVINIFNVIQRQLETAKLLMLGNFEDTIIERYVAEGGTIEQFELIKNPSQIRTSVYLLDALKDRTVMSETERWVGDRTETGHFRGVLAAETVQEEVANMLFSLLSKQEYSEESLANTRLKLLSVGIPSELSKHLSDRIRKSSINERSFIDKQFDVIAINVYKRDARFDDLVFKPQKFLFDLSLFQREQDMIRTGPRRDEPYDRIIMRNQIMDYESMHSILPQTLETIRAGAKYSFLSNGQKSELIYNHTQSFLLGLYTRLVSGISIQEDTFLRDPVERTGSLDESMEALIMAYITEVLGKELPGAAAKSTDRIRELLAHPLVDLETKDILRLVTHGNILWSTTGGGANVIRGKILGKKLFDRVFHIPLNIELFELDERATASTRAGRATLEQNYVRERLVELDGRTYLKPRNANELIFEDFFVTIENNI